MARRDGAEDVPDQPRSGPGQVRKQDRLKPQGKGELLSSSLLVEPVSAM